MFSVIFDMDGTLLDTQKICVPAWDYAGDNQGYKNVGKHIENVCGMNEKGWTDYLLKHFPNIDINKFKSEMRQYIIDNLKVRYKKGAPQLLEFLKKNNIKIAIASGSSRETIKHHLTEVNGLEYFDAFVGSHDVLNGKPAPDVFLKAAQLIAANPEDCFIFEDSANGIIAGHNAGMKCIGVPDIVEFSQEIKNIMFAELQDLSEAIPILEKYL